MNTVHEPEEAYDGPARLVADDRSWDVEVTLRGAFQPIDGRFHWYGRIAGHTPVDGVRSGQRVTVNTDHGSAEAKLSDADPWGRLRITGTGRPPF